MKGNLVCFVRLLGVLLFTVCLFVADRLGMIWLSLELSSLRLIPAYFISSVQGSNTFNRLFCYFIVSGVSSAMIVVGFLYEDLMVVSLCGILVKLGVFPFVLWVYVVMVNANWFVVWEYSTILKCVVFVLPYIFGYQSASELGVVYLVCVMFLILSLSFWVFTYCWMRCWCHMLLASSGLLIVAVFGCPMWVVFVLFLVYFIWSSLVILFFSFCSSCSGDRRLIWWFFYCFLLISHPVSVSVIYKLIRVYCVSALSVFVVVCWLFYSLSEQIFLITWAVNYKHSRRCSRLYGSL